MRLSGRTLVVLGAIVGILVIAATDQILPATSAYQAQMRIWLAARATGMTAYLALTALVALGLILSHPVNQSTWKLSKRLFPWHENLFIFVVAFLAAHIVAIILDPWAGVGIAGTFFPGLSSYRTIPVALGSLALYALLLTGLTARYTRRLPAGWWLKIHRLSLVVFLLSWTHGMLAGTDSDAFRSVYAVTGLAVIGAAAYRYWVGRKRRPTFATSLPDAGPATPASARAAEPAGAVIGRHDPPTRAGRRVMAGMKIRRGLVVFGVVAAMVVGVYSIQLAAALTAAAAPPSAPPVSLDALKQDLADEQARGATLQAQLDELNGLTTSLSEALAGTQTQVSTENQSATELARQLTVAQGKLAELKKLLAKARARLLALGDTKGAAAARSGGGSSGGTSGGSSGASGGSTGGSTSSMTLTLSLSGGAVVADWNTCNVSGFSGYALVRSTDSEIHWPPEDHDTEVARISSQGTTKATDSNPPSGTMTYRVWCLKTVDHETKSAISSSSKQIKVP